MGINEDRHPTLAAYLSDDVEYHPDLKPLTDEQLDDLELHAANLETALVNIHRAPLGLATLKLIGAILDNARDIAADDLFDNDCRVYLNAKGA